VRLSCCAIHNQISQEASNRLSVVSRQSSSVGSVEQEAPFQEAPLYRPLESPNEIRLLHLRRGPQYDDINCELSMSMERAHFTKPYLMNGVGLPMTTHSSLSTAA
jgi:hypothetical protein